tara:strand:- start:199 stop:381 length:183 start_codon:yes stop_codon:yes gene_type:complete
MFPTTLKVGPTETISSQLQSGSVIVIGVIGVISSFLQLAKVNATALNIKIVFFIMFCFKV